MVDADNELTVTLLDADQRIWTFRFQNAGFSVPHWPEGTVSAGWEPGIQYLGTAISRSRDGSTRYPYELESRVCLDVDFSPVHVTSVSRTVLAGHRRGPSGSATGNRGSTIEGKLHESLTAAGEQEHDGR